MAKRQATNLRHAADGKTIAPSARIDHRTPRHFGCSRTCRCHSLFGILLRTGR